MLTADAIRAVGVEVESLREIGDTYFRTRQAALEERESPNARALWGRAQEISTELERRVVVAVGALADAARYSPLLDQTDHRAMRFQARRMLSALNLRRYVEWDTQVLSDEDRVLGVQRAGQEDLPTNEQEAAQTFRDAHFEIGRLARLLVPGVVSSSSGAGGYAPPPSQVRLVANTAFILMAMDPRDGMLEDVKTAVRETFRRFGVAAQRADDIEHADVITEVILARIREAEFIFCDLTGERPNVYYELGYAHAIGKRPILFRRADTRLHFDLAVHNCPEYSSATDLSERLTRRLEAMTGKSAADLAKRS